MGGANGSNADIVGGVARSTCLAASGSPDGRAERHLEHTRALHSKGPGLVGSSRDDAAAFRGGVADRGVLVGGASRRGVGVVGRVHPAAVVAARAVGQDLVQDLLVATGRTPSPFHGGCWQRGS